MGEGHYRIAFMMGMAAFVLVGLSSVGQFMKFVTGHGYIYGFVPLFYVDAEWNIPTLFSSYLFLIAVLLLLIIAVLEKKERSPYVLHWRFLALGMLLMAIDELMTIHEGLAQPVRDILGLERSGILYFSWVIPGIILVAVLSVSFLKFLFHLSQYARSYFLVAAALFLGGALGCELIGGWIFYHYGDHVAYVIVATVEESLEMTGIILFIYALLKYIANSYNGVAFQFE